MDKGEDLNHPLGVAAGQAREGSSPRKGDVVHTPAS